jgi:hypothetical protein
MLQVLSKGRHPQGFRYPKTLYHRRHHAREDEMRDAIAVGTNTKMPQLGLRGSETALRN